jgi:hypothetical protein
VQGDAEQPNLRAGCHIHVEEGFGEEFAVPQDANVAGVLSVTKRRPSGAQAMFVGNCRPVSQGSGAGSSAIAWEGRVLKATRASANHARRAISRLYTPALTARFHAP